MDIILSESAEQIVRTQIESGRFRSESEVIDTALRLLSQEMGSFAPAKAEPTEEEFERKLIESGALSDAHGQPLRPPPPWDFTPIIVGGEPISETILRERR